MNDETPLEQHFPRSFDAQSLRRRARTRARRRRSEICELATVQAPPRNEIVDWSPAPVARLRDAASRGGALDLCYVGVDELTAKTACSREATPDARLAGSHEADKCDRPPGEQIVRHSTVHRGRSVLGVRREDGHAPRQPVPCSGAKCTCCSRPTSSAASRSESRRLAALLRSCRARGFEPVTSRSSRGNTRR